MNLVSKYGLSNTDAEQVLKALSNGAVNLLLGAGASYDAIGGDKVQLKGGMDLARELNSLFSLGLAEPDRSNLPLVYGDIAGQANLKSRLNRFLEDRYARCTPTWQATLLNFPWKRIWSLNIDDVIERVAHGAVRSFNWNADFRPRELENARLHLVHLHGRAIDLASEPDHLIFSISEYAGRQEKVPGWHMEFRSEFSQKPFIVCGARLQDEYDLATILEFGNRSKERGGSASLLVLREFAPGQENRFQRKGLIPVKAEAKPFFENLLEDLKQYEAGHPENDPRYTFARSEISTKFRELKGPPNDFPQTRLLDFYETAETQWGHIISELDAPFPVLVRGAEWLVDPSGDVKSLLIHGGTSAGKTAAALRAAIICIAAGYEAYLFRAEEAFSADAIVDYFSLGRKAVFVFDDCADYSHFVGDLLGKAAAAKIPLRVIASTEDRRLRPARQDFGAGQLQEVPVEPLRRDSFKVVFEKRLEKGRLGRCTSLSLDDAWREARSEYGMHLVEWLESLENAAAYREAILRIVKDGSSSKETYDLVCATATLHRFGEAIPRYLATRFCGDAQISELLSETGRLGHLAFESDSGIRLRSSRFSTFVWNNLRPEKRFEWSMTIAKLIAPLVTPLAISRRTAAYTAARNLMDSETLKRDCGDRAEEWYRSLEEQYGWNARFWEQRSLLASAENRHTVAYSYAKKAVSLHEKDSFVWTTLGKVCIRVGLEKRDATGAARFWEGVEALRMSRKISADDGHEWEHPYRTFFSYALAAARNPHLDADRPRLLQEWSDWMRHAQRSVLFAAPPEQAELDSYQRQWLLQAARPEPNA